MPREADSLCRENGCGVGEEHAQVTIYIFPFNDFICTALAHIKHGDCADGLY